MEKAIRVKEIKKAPSKVVDIVLWGESEKEIEQLYRGPSELEAFATLFANYPKFKEFRMLVTREIPHGFRYEGYSILPVELTKEEKEAWEKKLKRVI